LRTRREKCGLKPATKKVLKSVLFVTAEGGGAAIGEGIGQSTGAVIGAGLSCVASTFLSDIFDKLTGGWRPKIFGDKIKEITDK
jgi:hypothetical protein